MNNMSQNATVYSKIRIFM